MIKRKPLMSFVSQECCNFVSNECIGGDVHMNRFKGQGICYIAEKKPCAFFTKCVLPLAPELTKKYSKLDRSILIYETKRCKCGKEIDSNKRKCANCIAYTRKLRNKRFRRDGKRKNTLTV